ncbi:MAG TPA: hypothetical protein VEF53_06065 [Patescibacteria group bacterium]|nr:hypothetical protein [Patescibacteria group bacterium]
MSSTYIEDLLSNTIKAKESWKLFETKVKDIEDFKKSFHLRPTSKDITIVSTIDTKPMRDIHCAKTKLVETLEKLHKLMKDEQLSRDELTKLGFQDKRKNRSMLLKRSIKSK